MASEPEITVPASTATSGTAPATDRASVFFLTNHAALSITLVVGAFFLVLNLLLFAAIYRRNRRARRQPGTKQVTTTGFYANVPPGRNLNKRNLSFFIFPLGSASSFFSMRMRSSSDRYIEAV